MLLKYIDDQCTYASVPDSVFVECTPLDHIGFQAVVDLGHEFESESLGLYVSIGVLRLVVSPLRVDGRTFKIVVAGMQCVSKS